MATHTVVYMLDDEARYAPVEIIPGYTTVEDIPKILEVKHINLHGKDPVIKVMAVFPVITQGNLDELNEDLIYHATRTGYKGKIQPFGIVAGERVRAVLANANAPEKFSFTVAL